MGGVNALHFLYVALGVSTFLFAAAIFQWCRRRRKPAKNDLESITALEDKIRLLHDKYSHERPGPRTRDIEMGGLGASMRGGFEVDDDGNGFMGDNTARTWGQQSARSGYNDRQATARSMLAASQMGRSARLDGSLGQSARDPFGLPLTNRSGYAPLTDRSIDDENDGMPLMQSVRFQRSNAKSQARWHVD